MEEYRSAKRRIAVSVGESVRIIRELQELSQDQLARLTGIPRTTISAIENDRVRLGVERAKVLARALSAIRGFWFFRAGKFLTTRRHNTLSASVFLRARLWGIMERCK